MKQSPFFVVYRSGTVSTGFYHEYRFLVNPQNFVCSFSHVISKADWIL